MRQIEAIKRTYYDAKSRVYPEGLIISSTLAVGSPLFLIPTQAAMTFGLHEISKNSDSGLLVLLALGLIGLNILSIYVESRVLKEKRYTNTPITAIINILLNRPKLSSGITHAFHDAQLMIANPVNIINITAAIQGDQGRLFAENFFSVATSLVLWNIGCNELIRRGKIDPVTGLITQGRVKLSELKAKIIEKRKHKKPVID